VKYIYARLLVAPEDIARYETVEEVPVVRDGRRTYEGLEGLTLEDLPAVLDAFMVLEEEYEQGRHEGAQRKAAEHGVRWRVDKERSKRKKLGEW